MSEKLALVPVEPTEAMQRAYYEASAKAAREDFGVYSGSWDELPKAQRARLAEFGRAMIAAAPPAPTPPRDETGWLCEQIIEGQPCWYDATEIEWTADANQALRFARKVDAEAYIKESCWTEVIATEHMWPSP